MISNLRVSVAELVVWALLAAAGLTWISLRALDGAAWLMGWLRDRVTPLLEDDSSCDCCEDIAAGYEGAETCAQCGHPAGWHLPVVELPPERTWEQMTSHQLPVVGPTREGRTQFRTDLLGSQRERRMPWWETEQRQAYAALDLEYPSGMLARVRELAP